MNNPFDRDIYLVTRALHAAAEAGQLRLRVGTAYGVLDFLHYDTEREWLVFDLANVDPIERDPYTQEPI